jgi:hypothetical protein
MSLVYDGSHPVKLGRMSVLEENMADSVHAVQLLDLPDSVLQQHLLPHLAGADKKSLR